MHLCMHVCMHLFIYLFANMHEKPNLSNENE